jgi:hypothetical protein
MEAYKRRHRRYMLKLAVKAFIIGGILGVLF